MLEMSPKVAVVGQGTCASLAALYAGLMEKRVSLVVGMGALEKWSELFDDDVSICALQPRVMYGATIERLRELLARPIEWQGRRAPALDLRAVLARQRQ
jgi:thioredoxin reductase